MEHEWENKSDEEILKYRICDLKVSLTQSGLEKYTSQLLTELKEKGISLIPKFYLGDEWFSPEQTTLIAIPFYLSHKRLRGLEKKLMLDIEGGEAKDFMKLLRHECGHCIETAYKLSKKKPWKDLFGHPSDDYDPDSYRPMPYSKSYVQHLDNWYAQAHPDEDWAETFAVWLDPQSDWKNKYRKWKPAYEKLNYIEKLSQKIFTKEPIIKNGRPLSQASKLKTTLERYYKKRRKENEEDYPKFYDDDLSYIFSGTNPKNQKASAFLRKNRKYIVNSVSYWTGEKKYPINLLTKKLIQRAQHLKLRVDDDLHRTHFQVATYLCNLVTNYLFTGKFKRSV